MKRIFAFTLAETLLTLAIIGVVAGLSMPGVIGSYEKSVACTRVNKFYSQLNHALSEYLRNSHMSRGDYIVPVVDVNDDWWRKDNVGAWMAEPQKVDDPENRHRICYLQKDGTAYCILRVNDTVKASLERDYNTDNYDLQDTERSVSALRIFFYPNSKYLKSGCMEDKKCCGRRMFVLEIFDGILHTGVGATYRIDRYEAIRDCQKDTSSDSWAACTRLIELDSWAIQRDYPWDR